MRDSQNIWSIWSDLFDIKMMNGILTSIDSLSQDNKDTNPSDFVLSQNYPNPFNPTTKIRYSISQTSNVIIKVFDILGNEIETLVNEEKLIGNYEVEFNAINLPSGIYFYHLRAGNFFETKKMILLK